MAQFENIIRLPHVLDDIHRRTDIATINRLCPETELSSEASWSDVFAQEGAVREQDERVVLGWVRYQASTILGPLVSAAHELFYSMPTLHYEDGVLVWQPDAELWHREITLRHPGADNPSGKILVPRDGPILAVHYKDYIYAEERVSSEVPSENSIYKKVEELFGQEAVTRVDDDMAARIIRCLLAATTVSHIQGQPLYGSC